MENEKLYHVSEEGNIQTFIPRPSPSIFNELEGDVVFAISEKLLHNYLLPRDCPRVCYYANAATNQKDIISFFGDTKASFIIAIEEDWIRRIQATTLYCYELPNQTFKLLDECAGYYVSHQSVNPVVVTTISNIFETLAKRTNVQLIIVPSLWDLANKVSASSLAFSLIRMRNAKK